MAAESSSPLGDSKSSSDETEKSEQNYEYLGTGRSYECVFCKRGFTTAQALGGHMNIHRKHRAPKIMITNPSNHNNFSADHHHHQDPLVSSNLTAGDHHHQYHHEGYANFRSFLEIQSYPSTVHYFGHQDDHHQVHVNYQTNYNNSFSSTANWNNDNCSPSTRPNYSVQGFNYSRYDRINNIRNYDLLRDNWSGTALSLGLNHGAPGNEEEDDDDDEDHDHNSQKIICGDFKKKCVEIDLELRLGFDP